MAKTMVPTWMLCVLIPALVAVTAFSLGLAYSARGSSHDSGTTFYACLYAGSFSQINTSGFPTSCGRGEPVSWNASGEQGPAGPSGMSLVRATAPSSNVNVQFGTMEEPANVVGTLSVPAGRYAVFATFQVNNTTPMEQVVRCVLAGGDTGSRFIYLERANFPGSREIAPLQGVYDFDEPGTIEARCVTLSLDLTGDSGVFAASPQIFALALDQIN